MKKLKKRSVLIGTTSFGKKISVTIFPFHNNHALKITAAYTNTKLVLNLQAISHLTRHRSAHI
uniref:hypothetical protein n=1 Tax=Candidatus Pseudomonas adelgestsugas TaxID=1302376 RepID=UPI0013009E73|nr:hypothetical protein [Candidatus Pseudomonas adelgestsugas]